VTNGPALNGRGQTAVIESLIEQVAVMDDQSLRTANNVHHYHVAAA